MVPVAFILPTSPRHSIVSSASMIPSFKRFFKEIAGARVLFLVFKTFVGCLICRCGTVVWVIRFVMFFLPPRISLSYLSTKTALFPRVERCICFNFWRSCGRVREDPFFSGLSSFFPFPICSLYRSTNTAFSFNAARSSCNERVIWTKTAKQTNEFIRAEVCCVVPMKRSNQDSNKPLDQSKKRRQGKENVPPLVDALVKNVYDERDILKTMCDNEVSDAKVFLLPTDIVPT